MAGLQDFYTSKFPLLLKYVKVFGVLFKERLPDLHSHFNDINFPDLLWVHKWFQTLFLYSFPFSFCIRVWDNILADGTKFMFKAALALVKLAKDDLLKLDFTGINDFFKALSEDK